MLKNKKQKKRANRYHLKQNEIIIFIVIWFKQFIYIHENMDNQNHCMSIKQARLIVNAHKHNLLIN